MIGFWKKCLVIQTIEIHSYGIGTKGDYVHFLLPMVKPISLQRSIKSWASEKTLYSASLIQEF